MHNIKIISNIRKYHILHIELENMHLFLRIRDKCIAFVRVGKTLP